jgi:hypothetical protein
MPERIIFPEWRDQHEHTRYPFADGASLQATTNHTIQNDTFLDASLYPIGATSRVQIARITVTTREVTIVITDSSRADRASVTFDSLSPPDVLELRDSFGRPAGVLVSESLRLARFSSWNVGTHTFNQGAAEFAVSCVIPTPEIGVRGVLDATGRLFTGDLWLIGDNGVVFREEDGHIRVDIVGDPLFVRKLCEPIERFEAPVFIRTINGCPPDKYGNFNLTVGDHLAPETIVRIYPTNDGLVIQAVGQITTEG